MSEPDGNVPVAARAEISSVTLTPRLTFYFYEHDLSLNAILLWQVWGQDRSAGWVCICSQLSVLR